MSISLEEVIPFVCEVVANAQIIDLHTLMSLRDHGVAQQRAVYLPLPRGRVPADLVHTVEELNFIRRKSRQVSSGSTCLSTARRRRMLVVVC
ncbi:unnamed protein product [Peronospora effusa]|nr:unnamed protein product [Peronospora effusa]